jgi:hypothetical protein
MKYILVVAEDYSTKLLYKRLNYLTGSERWFKLHLVHKVREQGAHAYPNSVLRSPNHQYRTRLATSSLVTSLELNQSFSSQSTSTMELVR